MAQELFSPEQTEAIRSLLKRIEQRRGFEYVGQAAADISKLFNMHPLVEMERILREIQSNTYLIAVPLVGATADNFSSQLPHSGDHEYPFYLFPCLKGLPQAQEKMAEVETNQERNLVDLGNTGLLVARQGTPIAQMIRAQDN